MSQRVIKRYGHLTNVDFNDWIVKCKNKQRFYRASCFKCGSDRGHVEPRKFEKLCLSCTKTKHPLDIKNVDYEDFIKEKNKPIKYKMSCFICGADKGYKPIAYWNRRCVDCSNSYISKIKTKLSPQHRKVRHSFSVCLSARLNKRSSNKAGQSTFDILGYSFNDLIVHLESKFEPWMNWDNYGIYDSNRKTWHIDHVVPDSSFSYSSTLDEDFKKSWALTNLRPFEAMANILKSNKVS